MVPAEPLAPGPVRWREILLPAGAAPLPAPPGLAARLVGAPADACARLAQVDLLVAGLGAVGGALLEHLPGLGLGTLRLVDPDAYEHGNLATQPIEPAALGRPKVEVLGERLKRRSPGTRVLVAQGRLEELDLAAVHAAQALVVAGDNLALTLWATTLACALGQFLLHAGVHGPTGVAQVRRSFPRPKGRACPVCAWDAGERRALENQTRFACDGSGRPLANAAGASGALSALGGLAGSLLAFELVQWALEMGPRADAVLELGALGRHAVVSPLVANPACVVPHAAWRKVRLARPLAELSPAQIFAHAHPRSPRRLHARSLEIEGWEWVPQGLCECIEHPVLGRFVRPEDRHLSFGLCPACRHHRRAHPFHVRRDASAVLFQGFLEQPLARLGAIGARAALVRASSETVLVVGPDPGPEPGPDGPSLPSLASSGA